MIAHAIEATKKSKYIDRVVVSTDSSVIAKVARKYGAEVPFLRPAELATDTAPTLPVLQHAVRYYEKEEKFKPDLIVLIQPTNPLILVEDILGSIKMLLKTKTNSCFSVCEVNQRPEWMYRLEAQKPRLFLASGPEPKRSQELPKLGCINGTVYVTKYNTLVKKNKIRDDNTSVYVMPRARSVDIDDIFDFELAEFLLSKQDDKKYKNKK